MAEPEFMQMGKSFVGFYYPAFAENRGAGSQLANVYTDQVSSVISYDSYVILFLTRYSRVV